MKKCYRVTTPDTLEFREGGGILSLFGLPFLAAGVFVTLIGLGIVRPDNAAEIPGWCWPLLALMGLGSLTWLSNTRCSTVHCSSGRHRHIHNQ